MSDTYYVAVDTDQTNEVRAFLRRYGDHDQQYAVLCSTLIGMGKAMGINLRQIKSDIHDNWSRVPAPSVVQEQ